ncbi:MAG TPA: hypothetical protein VIV11_05310 [Kofleriaceae bacterium]
MRVLTIEVKPGDAAEVATIQVNGMPIAGKRVELPDDTKRVHVSVTAIGFQRYSKDVDLTDDNTSIAVKLGKRDSKRKRTLAVTLGMGALGVIAWLVRRR